MTAPPSVVCCPPADRQAALELLVRDLVEPAIARAWVDSLLQVYPPVADQWTGLLGYYVAGELLGTVWVQLHGDHAASLWLPTVAARGPAAAREALLSAALGWAEARCLSYLQIQLLPAQANEGTWLKSRQFQYLSQLLYLGWQTPTQVNLPPRLPCELIRYEPHWHDRFAAALDATYFDAIDFPELEGLRTGAEALQGYASSPTARTDWWFLATAAGTDVGVLILSDEPADQQAQLCYLGLIPAARGLGLGKILVRYAQWLVGNSGSKTTPRRERILLTVDRRNTPALALYARTDFEIWETREVYVRSWKHAPSLL